MSQVPPRSTWPRAAAAAVKPPAAVITVDCVSQSDAPLPCPALVFEGGRAGTKSPRRSVRRGGSQTCDLPTHAGEGGMG